MIPRRAPLGFYPEVNLPGPMAVLYLRSREEQSLEIISDQLWAGKDGFLIPNGGRSRAFN